MGGSSSESDAEAIRIAAAWVCRAGRPYAMDRDDLIQTGWLAVLEAQAAGRLPAGGQHRRGYIIQRAYGQMRDTAAKVRAQMPEYVHQLDHDPPGDGMGPEDAAHIRGLRALHDQHASPACRQALALFLDHGASGEDAAQALGISPAAWSQRMRASVRVVARLSPCEPAG
jgi:DNA-directed RNA polymerase specialized sigma24 family protein